MPSNAVVVCCRAGSCPLPVSVRPCLLLLLHRLLSLAHQRQPLPAVVVAAAATNRGGCARQIVALRPRCRRCRPAAMRAFAVVTFSVRDRSR